MSSVVLKSLEELYKLGLLDNVILFLLLFTIVYTVLDTSKVFYKDPDKDDPPARSINVLVALSFSILTLKNPAITSALKNAIAQAGLFYIILLCVFVILFTYIPAKGAFRSVSTTVGLLITLILTSIFMGNLGFGVAGIPSASISIGDIFAIIAGAATAGIIWKLWPSSS